MLSSEALLGPHPALPGYPAWLSPWAPASALAPNPSHHLTAIPAAPVPVSCVFPGSFPGPDKTPSAPPRPAVCEDTGTSVSCQPRGALSAPPFRLKGALCPQVTASLPSPQEVPPPWVTTRGLWSTLSDGAMKTHLSHLLAQARENNVAKGVRGHLLDVLFRVPLILGGTGPDGLLPVLLTCVATLAYHLPAKTPRSPQAPKCLSCSPLRVSEASGESGLAPPPGMTGTGHRATGGHVGAVRRHSAQPRQSHLV